MSILIGCLFVAALLPFLAKMPLAYAMNHSGGYDNNHPRAQQSKLTGYGARALAAHQNAFESLIIFTAAILTAIATKTSTELVQFFAVTHIVARIMYNLLYLFNLGILRSLVWGVGVVCSFAIIWQCFP